ncbi:ergot alkaloid biosynthesis protein, partial [Streptomyces sp. NPDC005760]
RLTRLPAYTTWRTEAEPEQVREAALALLRKKPAMPAGMDRAIAAGTEDRVADTVQRLTGRPPRSFRAVVEAEMR